MLTTAIFPLPAYHPYRYDPTFPYPSTKPDQPMSSTALCVPSWVENRDSYSSSVHVEEKKEIIKFLFINLATYFVVETMLLMHLLTFFY